MKTGAPAENLAEMAAGSELHFRHGRKALGVSCLRSLAYFLLLIALGGYCYLFHQPAFLSYWR